MRDHVHRHNATIEDRHWWFAGRRAIVAGELARRLLLLQRRRLSEDQLLDGRVRRALHDDVLPLLDRSQYVREDGSLMTDAQVREMLVAAHKTLATGGYDGVVKLSGGNTVQAADGELITLSRNLQLTVQVDGKDREAYKPPYGARLKIKDGDKVKRGQEIATSGMSGATDVPKLHFEVP